MLHTSSIAPDVALPRMTAPETAGLIQALGTAHEAMVRAHSPTLAPPSNAPPSAGGSFPPSSEVPSVPWAVSECAARLERAGREVAAACEAERRDAVTATAGKASRDARRLRFEAYRRAWTALNAQVSVWRETRALDALADPQRAAFDRVLPAGASIDLRRRGLAVWSAGDAALASLRAEGLVAVCAALGGSVVLAHLQRAHDDFGASLGVSRPLAAAPRRSNAVAAAYTRALTVLREYVLKVYASVTPTAPVSERLAVTLLAPLLEAAARAKPAAKPAAAAPVTPRKATVARDAANDVVATLRPTGTA